MRLKRPPNETGRYDVAACFKTIDNTSLVDRYRKVKAIDLPAWQKRANSMLREYVKTGNTKHLIALDALLDGIAHRVSFL
jgi:predicted hydrolase (HD superfamily)